MTRAEVLAAQVCAWNAAHRVGEQVRYQPLGWHRLRSPAWVHLEDAVVLLEGLRCPVRLDLVEVPS